MTDMDVLNDPAGAGLAQAARGPVSDTEAPPDSQADLRADLPAGKTYACMSNSPIDGGDPNRAWIVLRGAVDVFAVRREDGGRDGPRHPLFRVGRGEVILGVPTPEEAGQARFVLAGDLNALVHETSLEALLAEPSGAWRGPLDTWLIAVGKALLDDPTPWQTRTAGEPGAMRLRAREEVFGSEQTILWAETGATHMQWRGRDGLTLPLEAGDLLPLTSGLSILADGTGEIVLKTTPEITGEGRLALALDRFHGLVADRLGVWVSDIEDQDKARLRERRDRDTRIWQTTLNWAADLLHDQEKKEGLAIDRVHPPLEDIFLRVARAQGWQGRHIMSSGLVRTALEDRIHDLAQVSGLRARRVLLRGTWWRGESGPLIAFEGDERAPVALLPHGGSGYRLVRPGGVGHLVVDEDLAERLSGDAFSLYQPLPEGGRKVRDLWSMAARGGLKDLAWALVMGMGAALLALATPVVTGYLIDNVIPRAETQRVAEAAIALVGIALGAGVFRAVQALSLLRLEGAIDRIGQAAMFQRLLILPTRFFRQYSIGDLADRCLGFQHIRRILTGNALRATLQGIFSVVSLTLLFVYDWRLALIACAALGVAFGLVALVTVIQRRARADMVRWQGQIDGLTVQLLSAVGKLRVAGAEDRAFARWFGLVIRQKECLKRAQRWANWGETLTSVIPILCTAILFVGLSSLLEDAAVDIRLQSLLPVLDLTGAENLRESLSTGDFLAFNAAFGQALAALLLLARFLPELIEIGPYLERLRPILEAAPEMSKDAHSPSNLSGGVSLNHVTFRYEEGAAPVLDDLSLEIEAGSFVALVGPSGGGKSTLVRLLLGFETPESGTVFHDGLPLDRMDLTVLRAQVGVVLQDGRVNQGSIAENIIGTSGASLEDAWAAARMAGLAGDIEAMPMGMHTILVEGAQTLSGGQRQRLLLARALVGRPRLVILDEATSALDNRTQEVVTSSLERLHCTRIVIAHRLSSIMKADKIVVVDGGRIVESGTYETLMRQGGVFHDHARRQLM